MAHASAEFRRGWTVLLAAGLGVAFGASPVPFNSLGAFTIPLTQEFGWGRGDVQLAVFFFTIAVICIVPIVGGLADRYGVRRVALITLAAFGVSFAALSLTTSSLALFYALWAISGLVGGGSTPVSWTRAVNAWFVHNRGLALAITLLGTGVTAAFLPSLATWLIAEVGWRKAFLGISLLPLAIALPVAWFFFRDPPADDESGVARHAAATGVPLREALRDYRFWLLAASILFVAIGIAGTITNLQPLLIDRGFTAAEAARTAGAIGVSIICGRLLAGWLIDRFWAPGVTFPMLVLPSVACLLLMQSDITPGAALLAAALVGFASGAETDLVAYLSARYFGLAHYGRIYGVQYAVFGFASGLSPFLFGRVYDLTGSYDPILIVSAVLFFLGAILLLLMGRYPTLSVQAR
jgi:predicted MFS family arabinose efflux permease